MFRGVFQIVMRNKKWALLCIFAIVLISFLTGLEATFTNNYLYFIFVLPAFLTIMLVERELIAPSDPDRWARDQALAGFMFLMFCLNMMLGLVLGSWLAPIFQSLLQANASDWQARALAAAGSSLLQLLLYAGVGPWLVRKIVRSEADFGALDRFKAFIATLPKLVAAAILLTAVNILVTYGAEIEAAVDAAATEASTRLMVLAPIFVAFAFLLLSAMLFLAAAIVEAYMRLDPEPEAIAADRAPAT